MSGDKLIWIIVLIFGVVFIANAVLEGYIFGRVLPYTGITFGVVTGSLGIGLVIWSGLKLFHH